MKITAFQDLFSKTPLTTTVDSCLNRIKTGRSKVKVEEIRATLDKDKASALKKNLPCVCFSGTFDKDRKDSDLIAHSGYIVLDFDDVEETETLKHQLIEYEYVKATWVSPSGNGVKALINIADPTKHREHFQSLQDVFPQVDRSGINVSRVCFESYDPEIFIKEKVKPFTKIKVFEKSLEKIEESDSGKVFEKILKWLYGKGNAFRSGERNIFLFKLSSACCRFGIHQDDTERFIKTSFISADNSFRDSEVLQVVKSAYKSNANLFGSAKFENSQLVDTVSRKEVVLKELEVGEDGRLKDVLYGIDVKEDAARLYDFGYEGAETTEVIEIDERWKWKKGELTLLSGIGNYGKSTFLKFIMLMKTINKGWKFALFAPEDFPAHEFYHELVEIYVGESITPENLNRIDREKYLEIYDWIGNHYFFVYPKNTLSSPEYIKEVFLELIIKEGVNAVCIDPFNQLDNDYSKTGGRDDKYLEIVLADFKRFAQVNDIPFIVVAHPKSLSKKDAKGNYECPDVFDIAGGAMNNNKYDNILIYHRPYRGEDPMMADAELHSKKNRRQKVVGKPGTTHFELIPRSRRFSFSGVDVMGKAIALRTGEQEDSTPEVDLSQPPF